MNALLKRLQKIQDECVEKKALIQQDQGEVDQFTILKRKVAQDIKTIREKIKERDELEASTSGTRHTVEASHEIRTLFRGVKADARKLETMQKEEEEKFRKKNKENPELEKKIETRQEVIELVGKHIKEVEALNSRRHGENAFYGNTENNNKDPVITSLPDIDDAGFQVLKQKDAHIDGLLDEVSAHVNILKEQASEMGKEVTTQGIMLDELNTKVDKVNDDLENLNERLRKVIESIRKGDRFIVDIILLCILLGIAGYIYHMVSSKS